MQVVCGCPWSAGSSSSGPTAAEAAPAPQAAKLCITIHALYQSLPTDAAVSGVMNIYDSYWPTTNGNQFNPRMMPIRKDWVPSLENFLSGKLMRFKTREITDCTFYSLNIITIPIHMGPGNGVKNVWILRLTHFLYNYKYFFQFCGRVEE